MGAATRSNARLIVCNTGPLLHLSQIGHLELLIRLGRVVIPPEVRDEWLRLQGGIALPDLIEVIEVAEIGRAQVRTWILAGYLDPGEAAALALAQQLRADWFLTDDTAARV